MLIDQKRSIRPRQVTPSYPWQEGDFPCYLVRPIKTEAGNDFSLLFCFAVDRYIILIAKQKRYQVMKAMQQHLETADFPVFEIK